MNKAIFFVLIVLGSLAGTGYFFDLLHKDASGMGQLSSAIDAARIRFTKPGTPPDLVAREAANANHGAIGLLKTLSSGAVNGAGEKNSEIFIRASENHDVMLSAQVKVAGGTAAIKGAERELNGASKIGLRSTEDGRDVIAVVPDGSIQDLGAVDRINAMNIPDEMREKILSNYYKTGVLPEIFVKEIRRPASPASLDADDPANPKNF